MNRLDKYQMVTLVVIIATALVPWEGRWMMMKTIVPLVCLISYYTISKKTRSEMGIEQPDRIPSLLLYGLFLGLIIDVVEMITIRPLTNWMMDAPRDVSDFDFIKGDLVMLIVALVFTWLLAAFAEEFIWRGFVLNTFARLFGETKLALLTALILSSLIFGLLHWYQGLSGIIQTTFGGLVIGSVYILFNRRNLWLPILVHGVGNSISFVLIYFDVYYLRDFASNLF